MILSRLAPLILLPFVAADLHKLKLKKLPSAASNPALESAYLAEKYGNGQTQLPLMGLGGAGRNVRLGRPAHQDGEELYWTQNDFNANGGHSVPLSSTSSLDSHCYPI